MSRINAATRWDVLPVGQYLSPIPDSIIANAACTAVLEGDDGVQGTFTLIAGAVYPIKPSLVVSATSDITGIYNSVV